MAIETTTIRVARETRDKLARQAKRRGMSLSAMLSHIARREERDSIFRSEREASAADRQSGEAAAEEELWSSTLADGID